MLIVTETVRGPFQWRVLWGSILRPGFTQEIVEAYDLDEALTVAAQRRPELFRPKVAFLVSGQDHGALGSPTLDDHE